MIRLFSTSRHIALALATSALLTMTAPGTVQAEDFSDGQLMSFATAWTSINALAEEWKPQVEAAAAESEDKAADMLKQFEVEANQVIESTEGIGTAEYESIMEAAQSDPALKERIYALLQEVQPQ